MSTKISRRAFLTVSTGIISVATAPQLAFSWDGIETSSRAMKCGKIGQVDLRRFYMEAEKKDLAPGVDSWGQGSAQ